MRAVLDAALARPDIDADRVAVYGQSLGGYFAVRAASREPRFKAVVASTPIIDWHRLLVDAMPTLLRRAPRLLELGVSRLGRVFNPVQVVAYEKFFQWQTGASTLREALESYRSWTVDPREVRQPVLALVGEGEGSAFRQQADEAYLRLTHTTAMDWLEEVLPPVG